MSWISVFAIFFIIWWVVLFATLPFSLRTQDDEGEVTLGTTASAPMGSHVPRAMLRTTIVTAIIFGIYYVATVHYGLSLNDVPRIGPNA